MQSLEASPGPRRAVRPRRCRRACGPSRPAPSRRRLRRRRGSGPRCHQISSSRPSMYLSNSHASRDLPIPATPITETSARLALVGRGMEQFLDEPQLGARGRRTAPRDASTRPSPPRPATTRTARQRRRGSALPFSSCWPASSYAIAASVIRRVASPTRTVPGLRDRLDPRGGVDEVARHHALPVRADGHGRLAGDHAGAQPQARRAPTSRPSAATSSTRSSAAANGPLGVVLHARRARPRRP